ncbi:hypothetical protein MKW94_015323 [Papaver nudicaule]|uniref:WRKY19-like zinc finger domain-containing protein n=1 Tax=Papaver nudicaule TaxID=74823 RepID=A0AA41VAS8_PAPNU|nr:hypothetical protein [Papaver nudicaule]
MGTGFQHFGFVGDPSSYVFEHPSNGNQVGRTGASDCTSTILCLDSPGASTSIFSNSKVRNKWSMIDRPMGPEDGGGCSLVLGLGRPPSPSDSKGSGETVCTAASASEEIEESSLGIDLEISLRNGKSYPKTNSTADSRKAPGGKKPMFDLNLPIFSEPAESSITSVILSSGVDKTNLDMPLMVNGIPYGDTESPSFHRDHVHKVNATFGSSTGNVDLVPVVPDYSSTMVTTMNSSATCSSGLSQQQHRSTSSKTCKFQGCQKGARGASGLCISHGGGRRCRKEKCQKGAEGRTVYCKAHGGGRRCQFLGCTKSAEGRTDLCIAHGGGRRCTHKDCGRAARGRSGLCIRHGGGKRCQMEDCPKSAEGLSGLCISHGGGRRCHFPECTKGAQGSTLFCKAHGGGKRCSVYGCTKGAEGSTPFCKAHGGGKRCTFQGGGVCPKSVHGGTLFCVAHGGGKRCAIQECTKSARGKTDFCVRHGGGKRCQFQGCDKSAQGSTDFCKAHGGGKRCLWGQPGTEFANPDASQCDRFARGKTGLCSAHSALVQDKCVHGGGTLLPTFFDPKPSGSGKITVEDMNVDVLKMQIASSHPSFNPIGFGNPSSSLHLTPQVQFPVGAITLPEGRVHGGALMAMALFGGTSGIPSSEAGTLSYVAPPYNRM